MNSTTILVWVFIGLFFLILTNWAFMDMIKKDFGSLQNKAIWGFIALIPFIGFIIYFIFGRSQGKKTIT